MPANDKGESIGGVSRGRVAANTFNLDAARKLLRGASIRSFDVDWFGVDDADNVAVFLGDEHSPLPLRTADASTASAAVEAIARAVALRASIADVGAGGYRAAAPRALEPIFDPPATSRNAPLHEAPFDGYPHLVVSTEEGGPTVRVLLSELGGREVMSRTPFAAVFDALGWVSYEELHLRGACAGCRPVDPPNDPKVRSPQALTAAGLYVYGYARGDDDDGVWMRIASPNVPAEREDLLEVAGMIASLVGLVTRFENAPWIDPRAVLTRGR